MEAGETWTQALEREILEETGIVVSVGSLVELYSNLHQPAILMADFTCEYVSGDPRMSNESLAVAWVNRLDVLSRIQRLSIRSRMKEMPDFEGKIKYRVYSVAPFDINAPYTVHEDRSI